MCVEQLQKKKNEKNILPHEKKNPRVNTELPTCTICPYFVRISVIFKGITTNTNYNPNCTILADSEWL